MTQRGFIALPLAGYVALGMGAVILALGLALKIQSARLDAATQQVVTLKQQVAQWRAAAKTCSDATEAAEKEAKSRQTAALQALQRVREASKVSAGEVTRLKALIGSNKAVECPAGRAVSEVRKGFR